MKNKNIDSQKMEELFTTKRDCEVFNTCFINTKYANLTFSLENYKRGVYLHKTCKK